MDPLSSLAAHECFTACPLPHPLCPPSHHPQPVEAPCSICSARSVFCELSGQGFSNRTCEELVSIFSRQSQKVWEVMGRLSLPRVMKGNDQSQAPERMVMSASSILSYLPCGDPVPLTCRDISVLSPSPLPCLGPHSCLQLSLSQSPPVLASHRVEQDFPGTSVFQP